MLTSLRTVNIQVHPHSDEGYHIHHVHSPQHGIGASPSQDLQPISQFNMENKGHKKWLGEVIEVAEEAAAAAMRLSPRLSPHLKRDLYDFDENKVKSKLQYIDTAVRQVRYFFHFRSICHIVNFNINFNPLFFKSAGCSNGNRFRKKQNSNRSGTISSSRVCQLVSGSCSGCC